MRQQIVLAISLLSVLFVAPEVVDACGGFTIVDHRSDERVTFNHNATLISRDGLRVRSLWIYADEKKYDVFGIAHTKGPFAHLHKSDLPRRLPVYNHKVAHKLKQLWFKEGRLIFEGEETGTWSSDSLRIGKAAFSVEFTENDNKDPSPYRGVWNIRVSRDDKTVLSGEYVSDICPSKNWPRVSPTEKQDVVWKRITLYLAAQLLSSGPSSQS